MHNSEFLRSGENALAYFLERVIYLYDEDPTKELIKKLSHQYGDDSVIKALGEELDRTPDAFRYADETESISFRCRLERNLEQRHAKIQRCCYEPGLEWLSALEEKEEI